MPLDRNRLDPDRIAELLQPYIAAPNSSGIDWPRVYGQLTVYLDLLLKWNSRMNLTAIRSPEEIVRRHFGESIFAGLHLKCSTWNIASFSSNANATGCESLLDFGSGAGFPGLPIQISYPKLPVVLAESQQKKASFLREAVRSLGLPTEIWGNRVEEMPAARTFSVVTLRAVDGMEGAVSAASARSRDRLLILGTRNAAYPALSETFIGPALTPIPQSEDGVLMLYTRRPRHGS